MEEHNLIKEGSDTTLYDLGKRSTHEQPLIKLEDEGFRNSWVWSCFERFRIANSDKRKSLTDLQRTEIGFDGGRRFDGFEQGLK